MTYRVVSQRVVVCCAILLMTWGESESQVKQSPFDQALTAELIQRKYKMDHNIQEVHRLISPRVEPAGAYITDFRPDPNDPDQLILSIVPLKAGKLRVSGFGIQTQTHGQKYFSPVLIEVRSWPNEPAAKAIRAGVGELKVNLVADSTAVIAGERLQFSLKAEGTAALAILTDPEIKIRALSESLTEASLPRLTERRINWISPSKEWIYEWLPEHSGENQPDTLLFTCLTSDQSLKTILTNRPMIQVLDRPVFEIGKASSNEIVIKAGWAYYKGVVLCFGILSSIVFIYWQKLCRAWNCYWLHVAAKPETSFERSLDIYRKVFNQRYLLSDKLTCREREFLRRVERKIMGR